MRRVAEHGIGRNRVKRFDVSGRVRSKGFCEHRVRVVANRVDGVVLPVVVVLHHTRLSNGVRGLVADNPVFQPETVSVTRIVGGGVLVGIVAGDNGIMCVSMRGVTCIVFCGQAV